MTAVNTNVSKKNLKAANNSLDNIKEDIYTLRSDVIELGRTVKSEGLKKIEEATIELHDKIDSLKKEGTEELDKVQAYINDKPNQSVAIAFAVGAALALFLNRR